MAQKNNINKQVVFFILIDLWLTIFKHKKLIIKSQIPELTEQTIASPHLLH